MAELPPLQYLQIPISNPSNNRGCFVKYAYRIYNAQHLKDTPLILIAGFQSTQDSSTWLRLIAHLSKNRTIITFDHRGIGYSKFIFQNDQTKIPSNVRLEFSVIDMANDIFHLLSHLLATPNGLCTKVDILGYSMGGMIAQQFALLYPQSIAHLILMATSPGWIYFEWFFSDIHLPLYIASGDKMPFFDIDLSKQYVANNLALRRAKNFKEIKKQSRISLEWNLSPDYVLSDDELNQIIIDQMNKPINSVNVVKAQWRALKVYDGINDLKRLGGYSKAFAFDILIIHGDCDKTIDYRNSIFMHQKLPLSKLCIIKRESHGLCMTPNGLKRCVDCIINFCQQSQQASKL